MKNNFLSAVLLLSSALFSCKKEDVPVPRANRGANEVLTTTVSGNTGPDLLTRPVPAPAYEMSVGSFFVNGEDITYYYSLFTFKLPQGQDRIIATNGKITVAGKYVKSAIAERLFILFDLNGLPDDILVYAFGNLNNDWTVMNETSTSLYLEYFDLRTGKHKELRFDKK